MIGWLGARLPSYLDEVSGGIAGHAESVDGGGAPSLLRVDAAGFHARLRGSSDCQAAQGRRACGVLYGRAQLRTERNDRSTSGAAAFDRIVAAFEDRGADVIDQITGSFAIALFDPARQLALLAVDRYGIGVLFTRPGPQGIAFGTSPAELARLSGAEPSISSQALFDYLHFHVVPGPHSILTDTRRLLPGECVIVRDGRAEQRRYWTINFVEDRRAPLDQLRTEFKSVLEASVASAIQGRRVGAFLSGGTDSSTIAGMIGKVSGAPAETFSIGFNAAGYDEMEFARIAARHFGTRHHEYYVTPADIVSAVPGLAAIHDQPFGNASAVPTYYCAKLAREQGCDLMLGGDGGDELFGGNARYALQYIFSLYERVPQVLRSGVIEPIAGALARGPRLPVIGRAVGYVQQARVPMPARLDSYNLLTRLGPASILDPSVLESVDVEEPTTLSSSEYFNPSAGSLINRMLALDLKITLADSDLPKVVRSCELAGLPVAFPMLDDRVVEFSAQLAPELKLKGTKLRYFFKEALRDFLPPETISKKKQGFGLPFGHWAVEYPPLRELTFDSLNALKRRHVVRPDFIDSLKDTLLPQQPGYYGVLAWVLMMLEHWMQQHVDARRGGTAEAA